MLGVVAALVVVYFAALSDVTWPAALIWNALGDHLDSFQTWLSDSATSRTQRRLPIFNGIATFLETSCRG